VRVSRVSSFVTVTVAPGTTAPEASLTLPEMRPTLVCALTATRPAASSQQPDNHANCMIREKRLNVFCMISSSGIRELDDPGRFIKNADTTE